VTLDITDSANRRASPTLAVAVNSTVGRISAPGGWQDVMGARWLDERFRFCRLLDRPMARTIPDRCRLTVQKHVGDLRQERRFEAGFIL